MQFLSEGFVGAVVVVLIAAYVWVMVANTIVFAFLGFWRSVFGFMGEKSYLIFLLALFLVSLSVSFMQSPGLLSQKMVFPTPASALGLLLFVAGMLADFWSSSTLGWKAIINVPSVTKNPGRKLVKTGPYAFSRNPLYVADLVAVVGFFLMTGYVSLLLLAFVYLIHFNTQSWMEEKELERIFGGEYREYARRVPRFL